MFTAIDRKTYRVVHLTSAHSEWDVRIFHKECRSLARAGYEVIALGNHLCNDTIDGVRLRGLGLSSGRIQRMTVKLFGICQEAFRTAGDLYHLHDPELLIVGLFLRVAGKRVVYDIHEDLPRTVPYKAYVSKSIRKPLMWIVERAENAAARHMSGLVAATPAIKSRFRHIHVHTVVVNNYPSVEELTPLTTLDWTSRDVAVTYLGGISEERGIREILAAMDLLPRDLRARLELAGWFQEQQLQDELMARPQWRHVQWRGEIDRKGIAALLNRVRAGLVILHPEENFIVSHPVKLFEYMAAGIPVVASDFPLWRRIIEEAGCGLLVDPFDTHAIANAIERLITNPLEAEAMGRRGRKAVEERFNWTNEERTLLSFYAALLPQPGMLKNPTKQVVIGTTEAI
jgi:glycosyltransferase involved in cell wall biosynthesis